MAVHAVWVGQGYGAALPPGIDAFIIGKARGDETDSGVPVTADLQGLMALCRENLVTVDAVEVAEQWPNGDWVLSFGNAGAEMAEKMRDYRSAV